MSRVGGGGYAENRGGYGDRTGGGMSGNARDGRDGMGNRNGGFGGGMGGLNARRTANPTPSYDMNLHNMIALGGMLPGPGMAPHVGAMIAGIGPQFQGFRGTINGPGDYDPSNRFGSNGSSLFPMQQRQGIQAAGAPRPMAQPQQPNPMLQQLQMPAAQFNVPGPSQYGVNLPSYGYFGQPPALQRPQSMIMGGI